MRKRWRPPDVIGPLFGYDLIASTRRGQHAGLARPRRGPAARHPLRRLRDRGFADSTRSSTRSSPAARSIREEMAEFAQSFSTWCMIVQFGAIILITPIVVADAIAREKERRALDFLFVTALTDREIILGKLGSRLAYLVGVILTGLPILALTPLFGGIDAGISCCAIRGAALHARQPGALSLYCSVVSNTALQATVRSYVAAAGYLMVCPCLMVPVRHQPGGRPGMIAYVVANLVFTRRVGACLGPRPAAASGVAAAAAGRLPQCDQAGEEIVTTRRTDSRAVSAAIVAAGAEDEALPFVLPATTQPPSGRPAGCRSAVGPGRMADSSTARSSGSRPESAAAAAAAGRRRRPLLWKEMHLHSFVGSAPARSRSVVGVLLIMATALPVCSGS